ncbi:MAG: alginate export family protein [Gammaproteobacteria bacterium]|nr:alginate export family protein [Gammaproteobacteria bacterium]MBU1489878.1 alginate export family protein [Gammaproteobacteria bacterium]MBU2064813.1 alginate export family protein [Gammaproteobacteria bacterium]MBU2218724.1 alginate export family protein [Gammaproteobacteria bacterium]MBU2323328.1 alginate export family protein [Gammaproteobacteria bacterium]
MMRVPRVPSLLTVAVLASPAAMAGYTFEEGDLSGEVSLTAGGASISTRNVNFGAGRVDTRSGQNTGKRADWQEVYVKPAVSFNYALNPDFDWLAKGSVVAASTFGDGDAGGFTRSSDGRVSVEEAYAGFRAGNWRFTAGRQDYMIGTGFIVMDGNLDFHNDGAFWLGPRTAFRDSAVLAWSRDALAVQAFSLRTDDHLGDYRMNGVNVDYTVPEVATFGAMAMKLDSEERSSNLATPREGMEVYNLRALNAKLPGIDDLTLNAEYAIQGGEGSGVEYDAKAWYAKAEYAFSDLPLQPVLGYRYAYFSGDENLGDNKREAWDSLSKGFIDWGTWLIGDVVGNYLLNNSNQTVHTWSLKTHVHPTVTVGAMHYQFSLDEKNLFGAPVSDRRFADESVIYLDWTPTPRLYTSFSYNWVQPKAAAKQLLADKDFSAVEMYFTYRY